MLTRPPPVPRTPTTGRAPRGGQVLRMSPSHLARAAALAGNLCDLDYEVHPRRRRGPEHLRAGVVARSCGDARV